MKDGIVYLANRISLKGNLIMAIVRIVGDPVQKVKEESYFFNMKKYADRLLKFYEDNLNSSNRNPVKMR